MRPGTDIGRLNHTSQCLVKVIVLAHLCTVMDTIFTRISLHLLGNFLVQAARDKFVASQFLAGPEKGVSMETMETPFWIHHYLY